MSRLNDSFTPGGLGILIPQDHSTWDEESPHFRSIAAGVRVIDRLDGDSQNLDWVEDVETRGDYSGFLYWDRETRPIGSWREIFPAVVARESPNRDGTSGVGGGPAGEVPPNSRPAFGAAIGASLGGGFGAFSGAALGIYSMLNSSRSGGFDMTPCPAAAGTFAAPNEDVLPVFDTDFEPDQRYAKTKATAPEVDGRRVWPYQPGGSTYVTVMGTDEKSQETLFLPIDPRLVAPHRGGNPLMGTIVSDVTPAGDFDPAVTARLQTLTAVIKRPRGDWSLSGRNGNTLALNIGRTGLKDGIGGLVVDSCSADLRLGHLSVRNGGPIDVGGGTQDTHVFGQDGDGNPIHPAHLSGLALWRMHNNDGPMLFERDPYIPPYLFPYLAFTFLRWDAGRGYQLPRDNPTRSFSGMWRWETLVPIGATETPGGPPHIPQIPGDKTPKDPGIPPPTTPGPGGPPTGGPGSPGGSIGGGGGDGNTNYLIDHRMGIDLDPISEGGNSRGVDTWGGSPPPGWDDLPDGSVPSPPSAGGHAGAENPAGPPAAGGGGFSGHGPGYTPEWEGGPDGGGPGQDGGKVPGDNPAADDNKGWTKGTDHAPKPGTDIRLGPGGEVGEDGGVAPGPDDPVGGTKVGGEWVSPDPDANEGKFPPKGDIRLGDGPAGEGFQPRGTPFGDHGGKGLRGWKGGAQSTMSPDGYIDNETRHTLITHRELALPGISVKPQIIKAGEEDLRYTTLPSASGMSGFAGDTPTTGRLEGFGSQEAGCAGFSHTQESDNSRSPGGTGAGGMVFFPPELDMSDYLNDWSNVGSASSTLVLHGPGVSSGHGSPDPMTGDIDTGFKTAHDYGAGSLTSAYYPGDGTNDEYLFVDGQASEHKVKALPGGDLELWAGDAAGAADVSFRDNSGSEVANVSSLGDANFNTVTTTSSETYTITNDATDRTYDANATTVAELADVVATLIRDLAAGKLPTVT